MKDEPSHMMKFMRKVSKKKIQEDEDEGYQESYRKEVSSKQNRQKVKKTKKIAKSQREKKTPEHLNINAKNKKMKHRTPKIRERSNKKQIRL